MAACREPGISIASVALANGLNANLLRRWVVTTKPSLSSNRFDAVDPPVSMEHEKPTFLPLQVERPAIAAGQDITIELRRGATTIKMAWPLAAAADCAAWLRDWLR